MAKKIDFIKLYSYDTLQLTIEVNDLPTMLCYGDNFTIYTFYFLVVNGVTLHMVNKNTKYDYSLTYLTCMLKHTPLIIDPFLLIKFLI
jgi:hypothetical protein